MATITYQEMRRRWESDGSEKTLKHFSEALDGGHVKPDDFSIREMAEAFIGREFVNACSPRDRSNTAARIMESAGMSSSMFQDFTTRVIGTGIREQYNMPQFVLSNLIPVEQTDQNLTWTRQGIANLDDVGKETKEGEEFDSAGFGVQNQVFPATAKFGRIIPLTKEAVNADSTSEILNTARQVGKVLGLAKEKQLSALVVGGTNNYNRNGTASDTYQTSTPWINDHVNALADVTDIDGAKLLLSNMTDPDTGEAIIVTGTDLIIAPALSGTANDIVNGVQVRVGSNPVTLSPARAGQMTNLIESPFLTIALSDASLNTGEWFYGSLAQAFVWLENWPLEVSTQDASSAVSFSHDVLFRFKASWRGVPAVKDPRYMTRNKAS